MNQIFITNTAATFTGDNLWQAKEMLSFRPKGYQFRWDFKNHRWDGYDHLMSDGGTFPAGLTDWLVERLEKEGLSALVVDRREPALPVSMELRDIEYQLTNADGEPITPRDYQLEACRQAITTERGVLEHPTGAGKTVTEFILAQAIAVPGLVLVHTKDLLHQTYRNMNDWCLGEPGIIGRIGDGLWEPGLLTVATYQTLYRRLSDPDTAEEVLDWLRYGIGQVIVDEVHHVPAATFGKVMANLWHARYRFGLSATPFKDTEDKETMFKVMSWIGPIIHKVEKQELADMGYLVEADVFMIQVPDGQPTATVPVWDKEKQQDIDTPQYGATVTAAIEEWEPRNIDITTLVDSLVKSDSGAIIVMVDRLKHGEHLSERLGFDFISGATSTKVREAAWKGMREGAIQGLIVSKIGNEGLDIPNVQYLVMAGGGMASHVTVQKVGRGMRKAKDKTRLFVFDFMDTARYLDKHAAKRLRTYQQEQAYTVTETTMDELVPAI